MSVIHSDIIRNDGRVLPQAALRIEVIADLACPFCYLGKRHLDEALRAVMGPSDVSWYPFQINPGIPQEGLPFDRYLARRFGGVARVKPVLDGLIAAGREDGIEFRFDRMALVPNTLAAHQVMQLAGEQGADQTALAEALMRAFFEDGADIGDTDVLADIAGSNGIAADDAVRAIEDTRSRQTVLSSEAQLRSSGMTGVPGYLLNRRLLVVGAQATDTLIGAFDRAMFGEGDDELQPPSLH
jgi:predicted DsbA family dithiol-disulfide isomerase